MHSLSCGESMTLRVCVLEGLSVPCKLWGKNGACPYCPFGKLNLKGSPNPDGSRGVERDLMEWDLMMDKNSVCPNGAGTAAWQKPTGSLQDPMKGQVPPPPNPRPPSANNSPTKSWKKSNPTPSSNPITFNPNLNFPKNFSPPTKNRKISFATKRTQSKTIPSTRTINVQLVVLTSSGECKKRTISFWKNLPGWFQKKGLVKISTFRGIETTQISPKAKLMWIYQTRTLITTSKRKKHSSST